jgi:hypothetical protein
MKIIECNVWCSESDKNRELGLPDGDCWMPIAIDFDVVATIKEAGPNDFLGHGKATVYVNGSHFIIDIEYQEAVKIWKRTIL